MVVHSIVADIISNFVEISADSLLFSNVWNNLDLLEFLYESFPHELMIIHSIQREDGFRAPFVAILLNFLFH